MNTRFQDGEKVDAHFSVDQAKNLKRAAHPDLSPALVIYSGDLVNRGVCIGSFSIGISSLVYQL